MNVSSASWARSPTFAFAITLVIALVCGLFAMLNAPGAHLTGEQQVSVTEAAPSPVIARSSLVVHGASALPPFEFLEDGSPQGLTPDLWREIGRSMGRPIEFRLVNWSRAQEAVLEGEGDVVTAMARTTERERDYLFTPSLYTITFSIFARDEDHGRLKRHGLTGLRVAVTSGGYPRTHLEAQRADVKLVLVQDTADGVRRLLRGDVDAIAMPTLTALHFLREFRIAGLKAVEPPLASIDTFVAVHRRNPMLHAQLTQAVARLRADGTFARISARWAEVPTVMLTRRELWLFGALATLGTTMILLGTIAVMQRRRGRALSAELSRRLAAEAELERQRMTADLSRLEAEQANRAKGAFLANISHEIRTPMNAIVGLTHLMQRESRHLRDQERLGKLGNAAEHLLGIVNDVLDLSKIDAGKLTLEEIEFNIGEVIQRSCSLVAHAAQAKGLRLVCNTDDLPTAARGDPTRLSQVLVNLLGNAIKFTERGSVTLRGLLESNGGPMLELRFDVIDTGIGIDRESSKRLFEPFEQADSSTTRRYGGTGLGLAVTRRLVEEMNGEIGVDSTLGVGSRFWFRVCLPRATRPPSPLADETAPGVPPSPQPSDSLSERPLLQARVLLAEDDLVNQEVAKELLNFIGCEVVVAGNGQQALEMARSGDFDLILMDMQMPVLDGLQACRLIRALPGMTQLPIIAMTASAFDEDRAACLAAGMNDHIVKPVEPSRLYKTLDLWIRSSQSFG